MCTDLNEIEKLAKLNLYSCLDKCRVPEGEEKDVSLFGITVPEEGEDSVGLYYRYRYGEYKNFHMDNSANDSLYIRKMYNVLWGRRKIQKTETGDGNGYNNFNKIYIGGDVLWGGETIQTLASQIDAENKNDKDITEENLREKMKNAGIPTENCESCGLIGNYCLVPAYFNRYGKGYRDIWITRLPKLMAEDWDSIRWLKVGEGVLYENYRKENFNEYINTMFLWDFVKKDGGDKYEVIEYDKSSIWTLTDKAVRKRSYFMAAMYYIATEDKCRKIEIKETFPPEWKDWNVSDVYKLIMQSVFMKNTKHNGYGGVKKEINSVLTDKIKHEEDRTVMREIANVLEEKINHEEDRAVMKK